MLFLFLHIIEVEKIAVPVEKPVLALHVLHRQELLKALMRHMAAGRHILHVHASQFLAAGTTHHLGKIKGTVCKGILVFNFELIFEKEQQHGRSRAQNRHQQGEKIKRHHQHLQHEQRIQAEDDDKTQQIA